MEAIRNRHIHLIARMLIVVMALFIADRGIGALMKSLYFRQQSGDGYLINYAIDSTEADIIVLGSSRAKHSYIPEIFHDSLQMTCYNGGRDGTNHILFNYAQFKLIIKRYKPEVIIFDIRPEDLAYSVDEYDMLAPLLPFYKAHPEIRDLMNQRSPFEKMKQISHIYPFNSMIFQIIMGNLEFNKKRKPHYNGYVPFHGSKLSGTADTVYVSDSGTDEYKISLLEEMMETCISSNIKLIFVYSPTWNYSGQNRYDTLFTRLIETHSADYKNMSNLPVFMENPGYFYDRTHLNEEGATIFSTMLTRELMNP